MEIIRIRSIEPAVPGKGLIEKCVEFARQAGYQKIYIGTMPEPETAVSI
jgi:hypothetical protein